MHEFICRYVARRNSGSVHEKAGDAGLGLLNRLKFHAPVVSLQGWLDSRSGERLPTQRPCAVVLYFLLSVSPNRGGGIARAKILSNMYVICAMGVDEGECQTLAAIKKYCIRAGSCSRGQKRSKGVLPWAFDHRFLRYQFGPVRLSTICSPR